MILEEVQTLATAHLHDLYPLDKQGKGIVCPICGNGSGSDGDGVTFVKNSSVLHCFACGFSGDVIKLTAAHRNCSYIDAAHLLAEKFGVDHHHHSFHLPSKKFHVPEKISGDVINHSDQFSCEEIFSRAENNLEMTDYFSMRGLSLNTCRHFHFGFIPDWQHPKSPNAPKTPRLIVPTSPFSYLARDTRKFIPAKQKKYAKQKVGSVALFNTTALDSDFPFVTEGELDAASFFEIGFEAVALGSVSNINKFINHLKSLSKKPKCLILALDNDKPGKEASQKMKKELDSLNISVVVADNIYDDNKDANEALISDKQAFTQNAKAAHVLAEKTFWENNNSDNQNTNIIPVEIEPVTVVASDSDDLSTVETAISSTATIIADSVSENPKLNKAITKLNSIEDFSSKNIFAEETLRAIAFCKVYSPAHFVDFRSKCKSNKVELTLLDEYVDERTKPIKKLKKREDKERELNLAIESAKKHREELQKKLCANRALLISLSAQPQSFERDEKIIAIIKSSLERDCYGKIKSSSVNNFELIINFDPYINRCVGYDAFSHKLVPLRELPWTDKLVPQSTWSNADDASLQNHINRTYEGMSNERIFSNVLLEYAHKNSFHPVRNYLNNLPKWDGTPRAATFFIDTLDVEDTTYAREISLSWLTAAVARIFHPGCKWDYTLVIKGDQGSGKSTVFSKLARQWFNDSIDNINGKDALEGLLGSWIIELGEMQATKKADNEAIKSFLSRRIDKFRVPYGRRTEEFFRQCVFAATTNNEEFLKDRTGGRRFFILVANADDVSFKERMDKIDDDYIDQLWAEIFHHYKELFKDGFNSSLLLPSSDTLAAAKDIQMNYTEGSALEGLIDAYLNIKIPKKDIWDKLSRIERRDFIQAANPSDDVDDSNDDEKVYRQSVSAVEVAYELLKIDNPNKERGTLKEISDILARKHDWQRTSWKTSSAYGKQRTTFERIPVVTTAVEDNELPF